MMTSLEESHDFRSPRRGEQLVCRLAGGRAPDLPGTQAPQERPEPRGGEQGASLPARLFLLARQGWDDTSLDRHQWLFLPRLGGAVLPAAHAAGTDASLLQSLFSAGRA